MTILIETLYRENVRFRDGDLERLTRRHMASENFDAKLLLNMHMSFYLPSYVTDMNYITHRHFSYTFINRSIDILLEFRRFCQSSEHSFPPCLHPGLSTKWYDHSIETYKFQYSWRVWTSPYRVTIVTTVCSVCYGKYLNLDLDPHLSPSLYPGPGFSRDRLLSHDIRRVAKSVRPVISGNDYHSL